MVHGIHQEGIVMEWIDGIAFMLGGLAAIVLFGRVTTLSLDRDAATGNQCRLRCSGLRGSTTQQFALSDLRVATVDYSQHRPRRRIARVILDMKTGPVPFTSYFSSTQRSEKIAERINAFLVDPAMHTAIVRQDDRLFAYGVGLLFVVVGLVNLA